MQHGNFVKSPLRSEPPLTVKRDRNGLGAITFSFNNVRGQLVPIAGHGSGPVAGKRGEDEPLMLSASRYPDLQAHEPGCLAEECEMSASDLVAGYVDLFCACHRYTEPKILSNGTDIAWPAGWTQDQALQWRNRKGLMEPGASVP